MDIRVSKRHPDNPLAKGLLLQITVSTLLGGEYWVCNIAGYSQNLKINKPMFTSTLCLAHFTEQVLLTIYKQWNLYELNKGSLELIDYQFVYKYVYVSHTCTCYCVCKYVQPNYQWNCTIFLPNSTSPSPLPWSLSHAPNQYQSTFPRSYHHPLTFLSLDDCMITSFVNMTHLVISSGHLISLPPVLPHIMLTV